MTKSILDVYRSAKEIVRLQMDQDIRGLVEDLQNKISREELRASFTESSMADASGKVPELKAELEILQEQAAETVMTFTFSGMPAKQWKEFTEKAREDGNEGVPSDGSLATIFHLSLESVAYGSGEPSKLTEEECLTILEDWTDGDATALVGAAVACNNKSSSVPFG